MEGSSYFVLTPSANYLLTENGVIRRYVRSIDLEYTQLFIEGEGTVEYFLRILKTTPNVFNAKKYTSDPEILKLLTVSLYRINFCLSFGTKYVEFRYIFSQKSPLFPCTHSFLS